MYHLALLLFRTSTFLLIIHHEETRLNTIVTLTLALRGYESAIAPIIFVSNPKSHYFKFLSVVARCFITARSLICKYLLLKDISFNTSCLLFWCD